MCPNKPKIANFAQFLSFISCWDISNDYLRSYMMETDKPLYVFVLFLDSKLISRAQILSVISLQNGEKPWFSKGFCLGEVTFQSDFRERFEFSDFCLGVEVWFLTTGNIFKHFRHENLKTFSNHDGIRVEFQFTYALSP